MLPARYFLKLRAYLQEVRERERQSVGDDDGYEVIDYDRDVLGKTG